MFNFFLIFTRPFDNDSVRSENTHIKTEATGLRSYIRIMQPRAILTVRGLEARLVITLSEVMYFASQNFEVNFLITDLSQTGNDTFLPNSPISGRTSVCIRRSVRTPGPAAH